MPFFEGFSAEEAFALSQRFEFHYTPKKASWLNMIEIEFSALSKQCPNRRIATKEELTKEVMAIVKEREEKAIKIEWQFSTESAREVEPALQSSQRWECSISENLVSNVLSWLLILYITSWSCLSSIIQLLILMLRLPQLLTQRVFYYNLTTFLSTLVHSVENCPSAQQSPRPRKSNEYCDKLNAPP